MANLIIQENGSPRTVPAVHGEEITIQAPCDCSAVTGVQIADVMYPFYDAAGNVLPMGTGLFSEGNLIRVLIDTVNTRATIINHAITPDAIGAAKKTHNHTKSEITDFPTSMPASDVYSWAKQSTKPSYTASEVGARPSTWTPSASDVGAVPTSRTVNGKALSSDISLGAGDVGAAPTSHTHTKSQITDFPTSMTPTAHNQGASTITAGTFAGQVVANSGGETYSTFLLRNTRLANADTNPTVNGEICWTYK